MPVVPTRRVDVYFALLLLYLFFLLNSHGHRGGCTEQDAAAQAYKSFPYSTRRVLRTPCAGVWTVVIPTVAEVISSAAVVSLWLE